MVNFLLGLLKIILGMNFGWLIAIVGGIILGVSIIRNIFIGSFNIAKFAGGFNIFSGGVQGKLIYYGLIIFGCFCIYHFIMRPTFSYDTDYKNSINHNRDVYLDQRVGDICIEKCALSIQPFGFTILKVACVKSCEASITQTTKVEKSDTTTNIIKKLNPLTAPFRWIGKLFKKGK